MQKNNLHPTISCFYICHNKDVFCLLSVNISGGYIIALHLIKIHRKFPSVEGCPVGARIARLKGGVVKDGESDEQIPF